MSKIKNFLCVIGLSICLIPPVTVSMTGCKTPVSERVQQVQTLKSVGQIAEAAVAVSAQLYRDGTINIAQATEIASIYDDKFQPAYRVAVNAVQMNLDSVASPDLIALANQLSALVVQYQKK